MQVKKIGVATFGILIFIAIGYFYMHDSVTLHLNWPNNLKATINARIDSYLSSVTKDQRDEIAYSNSKMTGRMLVQKQNDIWAVTYEVETYLSKAKDLSKSVQNIVEDLLFFSPHEIAINKTGKFKKLHETSSSILWVKKQLQRMHKKTRKRDDKKALALVIKNVSIIFNNEVFVESAKLSWRNIVGFWTGKKMRVGSDYVAYGLVSLPFPAELPKMNFSVPINYKIKKKVKCNKNDNDELCVLLHVSYNISLDDVKDEIENILSKQENPVVETLISTMGLVKNQKMQIVLDAVSMIPYSLSKIEELKVTIGKQEVINKRNLQLSYSY